MKRLLYFSLLVSSLVAACVAKKPIGEGQECPCAPGYYCDALDRGCLPIGTAGTGGPSGAAGTTGVGGTGAPDTGVAGTGYVDYPPVEPGCGATCGTPAGTVMNPSTVDAAYDVLLGRWQFCGDAWQRGISAPADAIGIEFGPASRAVRPGNSLTEGGTFYFLVAGPNGPVRGPGFAYQGTYDIGSGEPLTFYVRQGASGGGAMVKYRYSPCPQELDVVVFYEAQSSTMVRFAPGEGVKGAKDGGVDAVPPDAIVIGDGGVATYTCQPLPAGTPDTCGEAPRTFWGWTTSAPPSDARYPIGCGVSFPVQNPYYPGPNQSCECNRVLSGPTGAPTWACPI